MSNLQRRLKKLEALVTDDIGLVPYSPSWWAYWTERLDKIIAGDDDVKGGPLITLEVMDAILAEADSAPSDVYR